MKNYFAGINNYEELRKAYKKLVRQYHPDLHPESREEYTRIMAEIISQYEDLAKRVSKDMGKDEKAKYHAIDYVKVINAIIGLADIEIEIVGSWIWVSGKTYPVREQLKAQGFEWSKKHKKWKLAPTEWDGRKTKLSMDQIRAKYGSERVGRQAIN